MASTPSAARSTAARSRTSPSMSRPGRSLRLAARAKTTHEWSRAHERAHDRAADVAGAAGHEDFHGVSSGPARGERRQPDPLMICFCLDVQAPDDRLRSLRLVRITGRRQRRHLLQLRPPQSRPLGLRSDAARVRQRPGLRRARRLRLFGHLHHQPGAHRGLRRRHHGAGQPVDDAVTRRRSVQFLLGASGAAAGVRLWPVVDGPQRVVAARRRAAHPVQHAVGPAARSGDRRHLRSRPDGHHLHRRRRGRVHAEQPRRVLHVMDADSVPARCLHDGRCVGVDLRSARARSSTTARAAAAR